MHVMVIISKMHAIFHSQDKRSPACKVNVGRTRLGTTQQFPLIPMFHDHEHEDKVVQELLGWRHVNEAVHKWYATHAHWPNNPNYITSRLCFAEAPSYAFSWTTEIRCTCIFSSLGVLIINTTNCNEWGSQVEKAIIKSKITKNVSGEVWCMR